MSSSSSSDIKVSSVYPSFQQSSLPSIENVPLTSLSAGSPSVEDMDSEIRPNNSQNLDSNEIGCLRVLCPNVFAAAVNFLTFWCYVPFVIQPKESSLILSFGKYIGLASKPGCYCYNIISTTITKQTTAVQSMEIPHLKVLDAKGNPLHVSGIVSYEVNEVPKALLAVKEYNLFLRNQAEVVMKQICSRYPYEIRDEKVGLTQSCLKKEAGKIKGEIIHLLQSKVRVAGIQILQYEFKEISYAPEIASQMLVRQQAEAMLEARKVVVEGAVGIASSAVKELKAHGMTLNDSEAGRLTSNLIVAICSESKVTPTMSLSANQL